MTSWLRVLGLHVVLLCILAATALTSRSPSRTLPLALLDSFDQVFALV